jgi:hypothetical protein
MIHHPPVLSSRNFHLDPLMAHDNLVVMNGNLRRQLKLQLPFDDFRLQFNGPLRSLPFNPGQHLKERCGRDFFFAASDELGEHLIKSSLAHCSFFLVVEIL